ncbi:MAG: MucR family transcriptional regulator [Rickettsiales bacterium]|jgi:predicted transcriptional regulator|nr:MucR family transcriptional regulator [Rickettsiales bacterium]
MKNTNHELLAATREFTLAVANLAAAAMSGNPAMSMADAVRQATDSLRRASVTPARIKESVRPDKIQCLEDETWHIMLRRYIKRKFNLTPEQYRKKWGLADDYPFVAPNYSKMRSKIAKKTGLGKGK